MDQEGGYTRTLLSAGAPARSHPRVLSVNCWILAERNVWMTNTSGLGFL